jgi:hypothetical protein
MVKQSNSGLVKCPVCGRDIAVGVRMADKARVISQHIRKQGEICTGSGTVLKDVK